MKIHTREKPYSCPVCEETFFRKDALKTHERIQTELKKDTNHINVLYEIVIEESGDESEINNTDDDNLNDKLSSDENEFENDLDDLDIAYSIDLNKVKVEDDKDNVKLEVNNVTSELEDFQDSGFCENIPGCHDMIEIVKHDIQIEQHSDIEEQAVE